MRILFLISILFFSTLVGCIPSHYTVDDVSVTKVYEFENIPKDKIYYKTLKWVALNTYWSFEVFDSKSLEGGFIVVKVNVAAIEVNVKVYIRCIFDIDLKDNKLKIRIFNDDSEQTLMKKDKRNFKITLETICNDISNYIRTNTEY